MFNQIIGVMQYEYHDADDFKTSKAPIKVREPIVQNEYDFISKTEEEELVNEITNFIFNSNYFTFMQKTVLMARLGFINNRVLTFKEVATAFGCSENNIYNKYLNSIKKLRKAVLSGKIDLSNIHHQMDFFNYFSTIKEVVMYHMNELSEDEIQLIKMVWKDDFSSMINFSDIAMDDKQVVTYYEAIGKLYNKITSEDSVKIISKLGLRDCHVLRK